MKNSKGTTPPILFNSLVQFTAKYCQIYLQHSNYTYNFQLKENLWKFARLRVYFRVHRFCRFLSIMFCFLSREDNFFNIS